MWRFRARKVGLAQTLLTGVFALLLLFQTLVFGSSHGFAAPGASIEQAHAHCAGYDGSAPDQQGSKHDCSLCSLCARRDDAPNIAFAVFTRAGALLTPVKDSASTRVAIHEPTPPLGRQTRSSPPRAPPNHA